MKVICHFKEEEVDHRSRLLGEAAPPQLLLLARHGFNVTCKALREQQGEDAPVPVWKDVAATWIELVACWVKGDPADTPGLRAARVAVMEVARKTIGPTVPGLAYAYDLPPQEAAALYVEEWGPDEQDPSLVVVRPLDDEARALRDWNGAVNPPYRVFTVVPRTTWTACAAEGPDAVLA